MVSLVVETIKEIAKLKLLHIKLRGYKMMHLNRLFAKMLKNIPKVFVCFLVEAKFS